MYICVEENSLEGYKSKCEHCIHLYGYTFSIYRFCFHYLLFSQWLGKTFIIRGKKVTVIQN